MEGKLRTSTISQGRSVMATSTCASTNMQGYDYSTDKSRPVAPLIVHPMLIIHVNNKRCDCNAYCSFCQVDNKRRSCRSKYSINR